MSDENAQPNTTVSDNDLFYLRSILRNLDELREVSANMVEVTGYGVANDVLEDNRDWLDCFIARFANG